MPACFVMFAVFTQGLTAPGPIPGKVAAARDCNIVLAAKLKLHSDDISLRRHKNVSGATVSETRYWHDDFGRLVGVDSPDASKVAYRYDEAGRLLTITKEEDAGGRLLSYDTGNGVSEAFDYLLDGTPSLRKAFTATGTLLLRQTIETESVGDPTRIVGTGSWESETFTYASDLFHTLTTATLDDDQSHFSPYRGPLDHAFRQDVRLDLLAFSEPDDPEYRLEYHYQPGSSRIEHINTGGMVDGSVSVPQRRHVLTHSPTGEVLGLESQQPDGNGGWSSGGGATLVYDDAGRLMSLDAGALTTFAYDYRHLRTSKQGSVMAPATQFYYDDDGSLLAEIGCWDSSCYGSRPVREYIWFAGRPVAYVRAQLNSNRTVDDTGDGNPLSGTNKGVFPIHTGLLGEPRAISNGAGAVAWRATYTPWGEARLDSANSFTFNLRLPGMYADAETDLSYNWHRYYAPFLGRYMQADPLLSQGVWQPAYAYAAGRPTSRIDLDGQLPFLIPLAVKGAVIAWAAFEVAATAYDVYDAASTLSNPCVDDWEKLASVGGLALGAIAPGGGYGAVGKKVVKEVAEEAAERAGVAAARAAPELSTAAQRSIRSREMRLAEHESKLAAYRKNPFAFDNRGDLARNAARPDIQQQIINGRIRHLEGENRNFQQQLERLRSRSVEP